MDIKYKFVRDGAMTPTYGSQGAAGADLYSCSDKRVAIWPGDTVAIPTGIAVEIPEGYVGLVYARSGLACKRNLAPANKVGVIDSDYRGEIMVMLYNHGSKTQFIDIGERVAQLVITPFVQANYTLASELGDTARGSGGFGSTGK